MKRVFVVLGACLFFACATSSTDLDLSRLEKEEGVFFGKITVYENDEDVTKKCYAEFTDRNESRVIYTSLDQTGRVYAKGPKQETYLSLLLCNSGGLMSTLRRIESRNLRFMNSGSSEAVYFGDVTFKMNTKGDSVSPLVFLGGGAVAGAVAAAGGTHPTAVSVKDHLSSAEKDFRIRFGEKASVLRVRNGAMKVK